MKGHGHMIQKILLIDTMQKVKDFAGITQQFAEEVTVTRGKYVVDGKSLLGLYSLNLSLPITVIYHDIDEEKGKQFSLFEI